MVETVNVDELIAKIRGKKKEYPVAEFKLNYDAFAETLEPVYFWLLDFLQDRIGGVGYDVEKVVDNFTASPGSGYFADIGVRATRMQDQGMKILGTINTVMRSVLNLVYDLKEFEIRLQHYDNYKSKNAKEKEAGMLALKQIWMDRVDIRRGAGSINLLTAQLDFVTLRDAFMKAKNPEDVDKIDLNERVKRLLKPRVAEFLDWVDRSEKELRMRFELQKNYLRSQVNALKLYTRWVRPYLKAAEQLMMKPEKIERAELVTAFNTIVLEVTLFGKNEVNVARAVDAKLLPDRYRKIKWRQKYYKCIFIDFSFRGLPRVATRAEATHYVHSGRADMTWKAYIMNEDEIALFKKELEKQDIYEGLRLVEAVTSETLEPIYKEIEHYMEKEPKKEEEKPKKSFWEWLLGIKPNEKKKGKERRRKETFYEKQIRRLLAEAEVKGEMFRIYDTYKKAHDMPTPLFPFVSVPREEEAGRIGGF